MAGRPAAPFLTAVSVPSAASTNGSIVFASDTFRLLGVAKSSTNVNRPSAEVSTWAGDRFSGSVTVAEGTANRAPSAPTMNDARVGATVAGVPSAPFPRLLTYRWSPLSERLSGSTPPDGTGESSTSDSDPSGSTSNVETVSLPWLTANRNRPSGEPITSLSESSGPRAGPAFRWPVPPVRNRLCGSGVSAPVAGVGAVGQDGVLARVGVVALDVHVRRRGRRGGVPGRHQRAALHGLDDRRRLLLLPA